MQCSSFWSVLTPSLLLWCYHITAQIHCNSTSDRTLAKLRYRHSVLNDRNRIAAAFCQSCSEKMVLMRNLSGTESDKVKETDVRNEIKRLETGQSERSTLPWPLLPSDRPFQSFCLSAIEHVIRKNVPIDVLDQFARLVQSSIKVIATIVVTVAQRLISTAPKLTQFSLYFECDNERFP